ncbi:MAG: hypothetical protein ACO3F2_09810 [Roseiflexaceae bacterium]|jgi:hypothetical protein
MMEFTWIMVLFFAASLAIRVGIVLLIIWGVIRLIDRYRTPVGQTSVALTTTTTDTDEIKS